MTEEKFLNAYHGVRCGACQKPIPFQRDPTHGLTPVVFEGAMLRMRCPHCQNQADYRTAQVERFRVEQTG